MGAARQGRRRVGLGARGGRRRRARGRVGCRGGRGGGRVGRGADAGGQRKGAWVVARVAVDDAVLLAGGVALGLG